MNKINDLYFKDIIVDYLESYNYEVTIHDSLISGNKISKSKIYILLTKDNDEMDTTLDRINTYVGTTYQEIFEQFYEEIIENIEQDEIDDRLSEEQIDFVKNYKK